MKIQKPATLLLSLATVMSLAVAPLAVRANDTSIVNSGDHASVTTTTNNTSQVSVSNKNDAKITQTVTTNANTGNNTANKNIASSGVSGSITTGSIAADSSAYAEANKNTTFISMPKSTSANKIEVVNTGDHLDA